MRIPLQLLKPYANCPQYTDAFYICTIISALACASVSTVPPERGELFPTEVKNDQTSEEASLLKHSLSEVDRYRSMDRLIPSPHNAVTIATLEVSLIFLVAHFGLTSRSVSPYIECHRVDPKRPSCILPTHAVTNVSFFL